MMMMCEKFTNFELKYTNFRANTKIVRGKKKAVALQNKINKQMNDRKIKKNND
jgi:hypothetical protein